MKAGAVRGILSAAALIFCTTVAGAEPVIDRLDPPKGAQAQAYTAKVRPTRIETEAIYARSVTGDLSEGYTERPAARERSSDFRTPAVAPGVALWLVIGILLTAILVWLRFGGGGMLFAREPLDEVKSANPTGWTSSTGIGTGSQGDILAQIMAMTDRRAAMVLLLRYCLHHAAQKTDTRFARSDTEREALRRLPKGWKGLGFLRVLLRETELAHYGGRDVTEPGFQAALKAAAEVLDRAIPTGGTHHA